MKRPVVLTGLFFYSALAVGLNTAAFAIETQAEALKPGSVISDTSLESRQQLQPFDLGTPDSKEAWMELRSFIDEAFNPAESLRGSFEFEQQKISLGDTQALSYSAKSDNTHNAGKAILHLHGGAYVVGSPATEAGISIPLSAATGMTVFSPWYGLAPESPYPSGLEDVTSAYESLLKKYGAGNVAITGSSAGGGLAVALVLALEEQQLPLPFAVGLLSPWSDLTKTGDSYYTLEGTAPILDYELTLEYAAKLYAGPLDLKDPGLSPVYADYSDKFPSTLIIGGTRDLFLSNCVRLHRTMQDQGADATLSLWDGMWHAFYMNAALPESRQVISELAEFLTEAAQSGASSD